MKKHIPNSLTLLNLLTGCLGILACLQHHYTLVPVFIAVSLIADFLDGFVARALNVKSKLGGQLDSLADMVTFGVLPGMMLFSIINQLVTMQPENADNSFLQTPWALSGFAYTLFACLRLAKFNLDTRQTENFIGLATPAGALFVLGFYMQFFEGWMTASDWSTLLYAKVAAIVISFILAFLMVAEIEIFSMKGNPFDWKKNKMRVLFLLSVIPQILLLQWLGLSTVIISYVVFAILHNTFKKKKAH